MSSPLRLPRLNDNTEVFWALLSRAESRDTHMSAVALISLILFTVHQEQRRKLTNKVNKKGVTYSPSPAKAPKFY